MKRLSALLLCIAPFAWAQGDASSYLVRTLAGTDFTGDEGPAKSAFLYDPQGICLDSQGNIYVADTGNNRIRMIRPDGVITTVAGTGRYGFDGDGGPARSALLAGPTGVAVDRNGNVYIADKGNHRIRRIDRNGRIDTVAGSSGTAGYAGDDGPARSARLAFPHRVSVDANANLYIADTNNNRIRKVTAQGVISTVAGTGTRGFSGDGGRALDAQINLPEDAVADSNGNLYISDTFNHRVRKVTPDGIIQTVFGQGRGWNGDDNVPKSTLLSYPSGLALDGSTLYVADQYNWLIRRVQGEMVVTVAGNYNIFGYSSDGVLATSTGLDFPAAVAVAPGGVVLLTDTYACRIRRVTQGRIETIGGSDRGRGDNGKAVDALLFSPRGVSYDRAGNLYVADTNNDRIRKIDRAGVITTLVGSGLRGYSGDGSANPATARLASPNCAAMDGSGNLWWTDLGNDRVRRLKADNTVETIAGKRIIIGDTVLDNVLGTGTYIEDPTGCAVDAAGNFYFSESSGHRVRRITPSGLMTTVAGSSTAGFTGDGGRGNLSRINTPRGLAVDAQGNLYIADWGNHRVRRVNTQGIISTVAGTGQAGSTGDGGPAIQARLASPYAVAVDARGNLYVGESGGTKIRRINPEGFISTIAGSGVAGFGGDGGPALEAQFNALSMIAADAAGNLAVADTLNHRVRLLVANNPTAITMVSGDGQSVPAGTQAPQPLVVKVAGTDGVPLTGARVVFAVATGQASLNPTAANTGADGTASTVATMGPDPGVVQVAATVAGLPPVTFTLTATGTGGGGGVRPSIAGVVSGGPSAPPGVTLAPNLAVRVQGSGFAPAGTERTLGAGDIVDNRLPNKLADVCVEIGGLRAYVLSVTPAQIDVIVPDLPAGETEVQVVANCDLAGELRSNRLARTVQPAAPEFFGWTPAQDGVYPVQAVRFDNQARVGPPDTPGETPAAPAKPGDRVLLFGIGFGGAGVPPGVLPQDFVPVTAEVAISLGDSPVPADHISYAGLTPGIAGLYMVDLRVPTDAPDGNLAIVVRVGGYSSPRGAFLAVRR